MPRRHTLTGRKEREQNRLLVNRARVRERQKRAREAEFNFNRENSVFF